MRKEEKGGGRGQRPPKNRSVGGCPDDPAEICREFEGKSVFGWNAFIGQVSGAFYACCRKRPPDPPALPEKCDDPEDVKEVCAIFRSWARDIRKWARTFTRELERCFPDWDASVAPPAVPGGPCKTAQATCSQISGFHKELAKWAEDIRYPLNEICEDPGPDRVDPPPDPPFE